VLDIIIVNYNSTNYLFNCLNSLEKSVKNIPVKFFVQDNASTDGVERILTEYPRINFVKNQVNIGFGFQQIYLAFKSRYLCF